MNPGPHGPEIWAVSSTETVFEGFEIDSRHRASDETGFELFQSLGLLHELLHEKAPGCTSSGRSRPRLALPHLHKKTRVPKNGDGLAVNRSLRPVQK